MTGRHEAEPVLRSMNLRDDCVGCPFLVRLYDEHRTFEDLTEDMQNFVDCSLPSPDISPEMLSTLQLALEDYAEKSDKRYDDLVNKLRSISYACNIGPMAVRVVNESIGYDVEVYKCNSRRLPANLGHCVIKIYYRDGGAFMVFND